MKKQLNFFLLLSALAFVVVNCKKPSSSSKGTSFIPASDTNFYYLGRIDRSNPSSLHFVHTGVSIRFRFEGGTCVIHLKNKSAGKDKEGNVYKNYYSVIVDNGKPQVFAISNDEDKIKVKNLDKGIHEVV